MNPVVNNWFYFGYCYPGHIAPDVIFKNHYIKYKNG
jgi:hypothetical protein